MNVVVRGCVQAGTRKPVVIRDNRDHWLVIITNDDSPCHKQLGTTWPPFACREGGARALIH